MAVSCQDARLAVADGVRMSKGIVVAEQPDAVEVGARILMAGGNAVDAAIACAFAQGVVDQMNGGVAGYGCAQVYLPSRGLHEGTNFLFQAPASVVPGMWNHLLERETPDGFGFVLKGYINDFGYKSIAVPGAVKGWYDAPAAIWFVALVGRSSARHSTGGRWISDYTGSS
jgi:gamma-glutamyltranspeptidase/glutathione hydrolase